MPRLLRIHFASIGHQDARLAPLTLDFRDGPGNAVDSLLWLRNGGGKSSIIQLFFSVFRPRRSEFLGAIGEGKTRQLDAYVKARDLAFVVTEWSLAPDVPPWVIGRVLAWKGQTVSSDPSKLRRLFFSLCPQRAELSFESLPIQGLGQPLQTFDETRDWLRALATKRPEAEVIATDHYRQWSEHLERLSLDPELFKYQVRMNLREGAADEAFRFAAAGDFVRFLLELAFDTSHADQVAKNLETLRGMLERRPSLEGERRFIESALAALRPLSAASTARDEAEAALQRALLELAALRAGLEARAAAQAEDAAAHEASAAEHAERARLSANERDKKSRWARGLAGLALDLDVDECQAALTGCEQEQAKLDRRRRTLQAALQKQVCDQHAHELRELSEALSRARAELLPERRRLEVAGSALRSALEAARQRTTEAREDLDARRAVARATLERNQRRVEALQTEDATLAAEDRHARERLARRDKARAQLQREGYLELREPADTALGRWQDRSNEAERLLEAASRAVQELESRLKTAAERQQAVAVERAAHEQRQKQLARELKEGTAWRQRLQETPCIIDLEAVDEPDLDAPGLEERLRELASARAAAAIAERLDGVEDERAVNHIDDTGLLPPPRDVERVTSALRARGLAAHAGTSYLADTSPPTTSRQRLLAEPERFGGVIVAGAAAPDVATLTSSLELRAPVSVSLAGGVPPAEPPPARLHVVPPVAATYDRSAAQSLGQALRERTSARTRRIVELEAERRAAEHAADDLQRFLERFDRRRWTELQEAVDAAEAQLEICDRELSSLATEGARLNEVLRDRREEIAAAHASMTAAALATAAIGRFIEDHEAEVEVIREGLAARADRRRRLTSELEEAKAAAKSASKLLEALRDQHRDLARLDAELAKESAGVAFVSDGEPISTEPVTLDAARSTYRHLLAEWERKTSENKLQWQIEERTRQAQDAEQRFAALSADLEATSIRALANESDLETKLAAAEARREEHTTQVATARARLDAARREQRAAAPKRREATDLPPGHRPATAAAARAGASELRAEVEALSEAVNEAESSAEAARRRATELVGQSERHHQHADRLVAVVETSDCRLPDAAPRPLPAEAEEVEALLSREEREFQDARRRRQSTEREVAAAIERVWAVANDPAYSDLKLQARERMRAERDELAAEATGLQHKLAPRLEVIEAELAQLEEHRRVLLEALQKEADRAGRLLQKAQRASTLPSDLGAWGDRPYLRIQFRFPTSDEEQRARLEPLVDRLVQAGSVPSGLELVQRAVAELAGGRGFEVKILKPDAVLRADPVPITALSTFSRGQQLTAAILLYCTLVQLRARSRGRDKGTDAGILLLDNPIGTCSSVPLLELQRRIARVMGVQLIYATGVDDLEALDLLPNKIRLRNAARDRATGDLHVTDEDGVEAVRIHAVGA